VLLIALLDTGVPVWALDTGTVQGALHIRQSAEAERLGRGPDPPLLAEGRLVVADDDAALAVLFGDRAPGHEPHARTRRVTLYAVQVPGVPALYAEEALWACASSLGVR
jgi:hypothetical protein